MGRTRNISQSEKILTAATELFWKKGYTETSMDKLAKVTKLNKATLYYYFPTKNQILVTFLSRALIELSTIVKEVFGKHQSPEDRLREMVKVHVKWQLNNPKVGLLGYRELRLLSPKAKKTFLEMRDEYESMFRETVQEILAAQKSPTTTVKFSTMLLLGGLNSMVRWYKKSGELTQDEIAEESAAFICQALQCHSGK